MGTDRPQQGQDGRAQRPDDRVARFGLVSTPRIQQDGKRKSGGLLFANFDARLQFLSKQVSLHAHMISIREERAAREESVPC